MFTIILLLPLFSSILILLFGRFLGTYGSMLLSSFNLVLAWCFSIYFYNAYSHSFNFYLDAWNWLNISDFTINFSLKYDGLTAIMFLVVTTISSLVHIYSCVYMYLDPFLARFMSYLSLFTFFMLLLVSSSNFLVLFMGWEGVGLCSYLLIGFWHTRFQAGKAATKAFAINKVGDLFLLTGISLIFMTFHSVDFSVVSALAPYYSETMIELISFFLFIGAVGKSAQIGLHTWLPDAMEGERVSTNLPTPVSALIHAATMVTAGVFLIIRCSTIFEYAPRILYLIAIWGGLTALFSGTIGSVQNDIKKIIAYSTCSQLGYMVLACGLSLYQISFFHLFNHAFFKALLFLSAGSIIHLMSNEQDIRKMGGLGKLSPFVYVNVLIASLALAGFPFLAGFYSKDLIIEAANTKFWVNSQFVYWLSMVAAMLTMYYSMRLLLVVFVNDYNGFKVILKQHVKITNVEITVLGLLGILSITSGFYFKDAFSGFGSNYFNNSILLLPTTWSFIDLEFIPSVIKLMPVFASIISFVISLYFNFNYDLTKYQLLISKTYFEVCKLFYNEFINNYISINTFKAGRHFFEQYEKRTFELHGPVFFINLISKTSDESIFKEFSNKHSAKIFSLICTIPNVTDSQTIQPIISHEADAGIILTASAVGAFVGFAASKKTIPILREFLLPTRTMLLNKPFCTSPATVTWVGVAGSTFFSVGCTVGSAATYAAGAEWVMSSAAWQRISIAKEGRIKK